MAKKIRRIHPMRGLSNRTGREIKQYLRLLEKLILQELQQHEEFADDLNPADVDRFVDAISSKIEVVRPKIDRTLSAAIKTSFTRGATEAAKKHVVVSTPSGPGTLFTKGPKKSMVKMLDGSMKWFDNKNLNMEKLTQALLPADAAALEQHKFMAMEFFKSLGADIKNESRKILLDVMRVGKSPREAIPRIKNIFRDLKTGKQLEGKVRGSRIATTAEAMSRTLVVEAYNTAQYKRDEASGVVWGHEWIAADDEITCPICGGKDHKGRVVNKKPMDGQVRKNGEMFHTQYKGRVYKVMAPPVHINCRCRITAITFVEAKRRGLR